MRENDDACSSRVVDEAGKQCYLDAPTSIFEKKILPT